MMYKSCFLAISPIILISSSVYIVPVGFTGLENIIALVVGVIRLSISSWEGRWKLFSIVVGIGLTFAPENVEKLE